MIHAFRISAYASTFLGCAMYEGLTRQVSSSVHFVRTHTHSERNEEAGDDCENNNQPYSFFLSDAGDIGRKSSRYALAGELSARQLSHSESFIRPPVQSFSLDDV